MILDMTTKNTSALQLAEDLKSFGVGNHSAHLFLIDLSIQGIDPYSEDLDSSTKQRIIGEARNNPWYFLREVVRVRNTGTGAIDRFRMDKANVALMKCFMHKISEISVRIPRRTGASVGAAAVGIWKFINGFDRPDIIERITVPGFHYIILPSFMTDNWTGTTLDGIRAYRNGNLYLLERKNFKGELGVKYQWVQGYYKPHEVTPSALPKDIRIIDDQETALAKRPSSTIWNTNLLDAVGSELSFIDKIHIWYPFMELGYGVDWVEEMSTALFRDHDRIEREIFLKG